MALPEMQGMATIVVADYSVIEGGTFGTQSGLGVGFFSKLPIVLDVLGL